MGFAGEGPSVYPIVNCDLSDVVGAPGLPAPDVLARTMSKRNHSWKSVGGPDTLFLATSTIEIVAAKTRGIELWTGRPTPCGHSSTPLRLWLGTQRERQSAVSGLPSPSYPSG
jgi:hypothetical protein